MRSRNIKQQRGAVPMQTDNEFPGQMRGICLTQLLKKTSRT
jgi:hypothetical protein